jgi:hypothetical protein
MFTENTLSCPCSLSLTVRKIEITHYQFDEHRPKTFAAFNEKKKRFSIEDRFPFINKLRKFLARNSQRLRKDRLIPYAVFACTEGKKTISSRSFSLSFRSLLIRRVLILSTLHHLPLNVD